MGKGERINRMIAWLESKIDAGMARSGEAETGDTIRAMSVLAHLYQLQQTSVRMERQRKMMEEVREDVDVDLPKPVNN